MAEILEKMIAADPQRGAALETLAGLRGHLQTFRI